MTPERIAELRAFINKPGLSGTEGIYIAQIETSDCLDTIEAQQRRIEELEAAISWAYETLMEINVSNYTHDDVCNLNNRSVEVILGLAALQPKEPSWNSPT